MDSGPTLICLLFLWTVRICWTQAGPPGFRMRQEETEEVFRNLACESSADPEIMQELQTCAKELTNNQQLGFHMRLQRIAQFGCISPMTGYATAKAEMFSPQNAMEPMMLRQSKQPAAPKIKRKKIVEEGAFSEDWKKFLLEAGMDPAIEEGNIEFEVTSTKEKIPEGSEAKAEQSENRRPIAQAARKVSTSSIYDDILGGRTVTKGIPDAISKVQNVQQNPPSLQRVQSYSPAQADAARKQSTFRQRLQEYFAHAEAMKRQNQQPAAGAQKNLGQRIAVVNTKQNPPIPQKVQYVTVNRQNPQIPQKVQYVSVNRQNPQIPPRVKNYFAQAEAINRQNPSSPQRVQGPLIQLQPVAINRQNLGSPIAVAGTQQQGASIAVAGTPQNFGSSIAVAGTGTQQNLGNRFAVANSKQPTVANAVAIGTGNSDEVVSATSIQITGPDGKPLVSETSKGITNLKSLPKNLGLRLGDLDLKKLQSQFSNTNANAPAVANAVAIGTGNSDEVVSATSIQITGPDGKPLVSETSKGITNLKAPYPGGPGPKPAVANAVAFGSPGVVTSSTSIQITGPDGKPLTNEKSKSTTNLKGSQAEKSKNSKQFSDGSKTKQAFTNALPSFLGNAIGDDPMWLDLKKLNDWQENIMHESSPVSIMQKSVSKSGMMNEGLRRTLVEAGMDPKNKEADIAFEVTSVKRKIEDDKDKGVSTLSGDWDDKPEEFVNMDPNMQRMDPNMQRMDPNMQRMDPNLQRMDPNMQRMDPNIQRMDPNIQRMDPNLQRLDPNLLRMDPNMQRMDPNIQGMADIESLRSSRPIFGGRPFYFRPPFFRQEMPQLEPDFLPPRVTEDLRETFASYGPPHAYAHSNEENLQDVRYFPPGASGAPEENELYDLPFAESPNSQSQEGLENIPFLMDARPPPGFGFRRKRQDYLTQNQFDLQKMKEFISQEIRVLKMEKFENCILAINTIERSTGNEP